MSTTTTDRGAASPGMPGPLTPGGRTTGARPGIQIGAMVRALYGLLPSRVRRGWGLIVVLTGLCSVVELATTALLLSVIRLATQPAANETRQLFPWMPGAALALVGFQAALLATALIASVFLLRVALGFALTAAVNSATEATGLLVSERLLSHYVRMPYAAFRQRSVAELHQRVTQLAGTVVNLVFRPGVQVVTDVAVIGSVLAVLVVASPWGTLAAGALVVTVAVVLIRVVGPELYRLGARITQYDRWAHVFVDQVLQGRREITLRHHEARVVSSYVEERRAAEPLGRRRALLLDLPRIVIEGVTTIIVAGLIIFAVSLGLDTPRVLATLGLFAYALVRMMPLAGRVATNLATFRSGLPALDIVLQDVPPPPSPSPNGPQPRSGPTAALTGDIEFRHVSYCHEGSRHPALRDVSVRIEAGSFVAVVGPSGAGKSTFVDLLLGLLVPTAGEVLVGGRSLRELVDGWQAGVGVVSQETYIFNDSILRNVVLFADRIDSRRVVKVLEDVGLWELVDRLPHGVDTRIGERGSALSGGQRQRLAIARALYSSPSLLVLDEATSALDPDAEAMVLRAALRGDDPRTVVAVTHRASTIADCDHVIVLEDGVVTAVGTYAQVSQASAYFTRMVGPAVSGRLG